MKKHLYILLLCLTPVFNSAMEQDEKLFDTFDQLSLKEVDEEEEREKSLEYVVGFMGIETLLNKYSNLEALVFNLKEKKLLEARFQQFKKQNSTLLQRAVIYYFNIALDIKSCITGIKIEARFAPDTKPDFLSQEEKNELWEKNLLLSKCTHLIQVLLDAGAKIHITGPWRKITTYKFVVKSKAQELVEIFVAENKKRQESKKEKLPVPIEKK